MANSLIVVASYCLGIAIVALGILVATFLLGILFVYLEDWGWNIPSAPASPDQQKTWKAFGLLTEESKTISHLLHELKDQTAEHHAEHRRVQSEHGDLFERMVLAISQTSVDAHELARRLRQQLGTDVHVAVTSGVDRLLRDLPQSIREAKSERSMDRQRRWASA
ncbi:hypothetical protein F4781DRAFT_430902 [Annulohypoxylon bovei var. microspora]|nr:hypothetical protein F4781DRAFT_430902 [Annulohypoxylon bovei var. microspora]